jgi:uncharacterized membrane protein YjjP (DUF1212 family)
MSKRNWILVANVVGFFIVVPVALVVLAFALMLFGPFAVVLVIFGALGAQFLVRVFLETWRKGREIQKQRPPLPWWRY